ncbi:hypothetical protein WMF27_22625 [Sorangium sp. So ce281]|uniref:hypothetical protein n=1 Tax=unclassified Sorangium TaxID=2621164 RepID=UPI003F609026
MAEGLAALRPDHRVAPAALVAPARVALRVHLARLAQRAVQHRLELSLADLLIEPQQRRVDVPGERLEICGIPCVDAVGQEDRERSPLGGDRRGGGRVAAVQEHPAARRHREAQAEERRPRGIKDHKNAGHMKRGCGDLRAAVHGSPRINETARAIVVLFL